MRGSVIVLVLASVVGVVLLTVPHALSQRSAASLMDPETAALELERASRESERAQRRAEILQSQAREATEAADKAARETAALAAQIQQAEADFTAAQARYALAEAQHLRVAGRLAKRREPLVRLTSALQTTSRRPLTLSVLQPGSLKDVVYVRAVLASAVPQIRARTRDLRDELDRVRQAEADAMDALESLRQSEKDLNARRTQLVAIEAEARTTSRSARSNAVRQNERALALAEEARDLDGLIDRLDDAAKLRRELAQLPGPKPRPAQLSVNTQSAELSEPLLNPDPPALAANAAPVPYQLPVHGRILAGFGEARPSGLRNNGVALAPAAGAQVVAPAKGRVVFAGAYRGYDQIIIVEHGNGWTSLVTGMERIDVSVGAELIAGSPLGIAGRRDPVIGLELRRDGETVNPIEFVR